MHHRVSPAALAAGVLLAACHTMRPVRPAELTGIGVERVWVTRADHSTVVMLQPAVQGDTLEGLIFGEYQKMPVSDALAIRTRRAAPARTAALVLGAAAVFMAGVIYMGNRSDVGPSAQTCTTGLPDDNPIACPHQ